MSQEILDSKQKFQTLMQIGPNLWYDVYLAENLISQV